MVIHRFVRWLRERFARRAISRDISDELRFHLAKRTAEYEGVGMSPEEARRAANRRFGDMLQAVDLCHDAQQIPHRKDNLMERARAIARPSRSGPVNVR